jgi:proteasome lid subunit RPN8/RPN11
MEITLSHALYEQLCEYCRTKLPEEACGFIYGAPVSTGYIASSIQPVTNCASNPFQHFEMKPDEVIPLLYKQEDSRQLIGMFHSHPTKEAVPSQEDLQTGWHTLASYWIVSFRDINHPVLQIYDIKKAPLTAARKLSFVIDQ